MTKITLTAEVGRQLSKIPYCVQLCDDAGNVIGLFTPVTDLVLEPTISEEELDRRENEPCFTTEQVLAHLRTL